MNRAVFSVVLLAAALLCLCQTTANASSRPLRKFSKDQLIACFDDHKICGSSDIYAISDELARRLPSLSTDQLVSCFADWKICGAADSQASGWPISDELARRGNPDKILQRYWTEPDASIREGIIDLAYHFKTPGVTAFMRRVLTEGRDQDGYLYWPANYLAKQCDAAGLQWISSRPGRVEGCLQFQTTVPLFGKCAYRPAIPYLIKFSLDDACLNIVDAAETDLAKMYPGSPKSFKNMDEMRQYYCTRASQEGFKMDCKSM